MESMPCTGRTLPLSESSPKSANSARPKGLICWEAAKTPTAMGRSKAEPSFLRSAGARLMVTLRRGH